MNKVKPGAMFVDFLETIFLLSVIAFFVFYFIVEGNWSIAEEITKVSSSLSFFGAIFFLKLKKIKTEIREKKEKDESLDDIFTYFNKKDKLKSIISISLILISMSFINYFLGIDIKSEFNQILLTLFILYSWHFYLFRKRDSVVVRMYAIFLDKIIDSILMYFISILILIIPWFFNAYGYADILNAVITMIIMYIRHKLIFDLNDKK